MARRHSHLYGLATPIHKTSGFGQKWIVEPSKGMRQKYTYVIVLRREISRVLPRKKFQRFFLSIQQLLELFTNQHIRRESHLFR